MVENSQAQTLWWGSFSLAEEHAGRWRVGPGTVWIYRARHEWRIVHEQADDPLDDAAEILLPAPPEAAMPSLQETPPAARVSRFSFRQTDEHLTLAPALADRAVVMRPERPLYVPEGETVTLYVSTPLWMRVEVGQPARLLHEFPLYRPSDTWFGPSTQEGEICYAVRTTGRLKLETLPLRLHRAVTPLVVHNQAKDALLLEHVRLPVQYLSLFQAATDFLWTQTVTLDRDKDGDLATLHLGVGAPPEAPEARLIGDPRETSTANLIVRAFSTVFSKIRGDTHHGRYVQYGL